MSIYRIFLTNIYNNHMHIYCYFHSVFLYYLINIINHHNVVLIIVKVILNQYISR